MKKQEQIVLTKKPSGYLTHRDYLEAHQYGVERLSKMLEKANVDVPHAIDVQLVRALDNIKDHIAKIESFGEHDRIMAIVSLEGYNAGIVDNIWVQLRLSGLVVNPSADAIYEQ